MKKRYSKHFLLISLLGLLVFTASLANAQNQIVVSGAGTSAVNGVYSYAGISNGNSYYTKGNYRIEYRFDMYDWGFTLWELWDVTDIYDPLYCNFGSSSTPVMSGWFAEYGNSPAPTFTYGVGFTGGSSYVAPSGVSNTNNNPVGRFFLNPGVTGISLSSVAVQFSASGSGINNVKLWSSVDNTFNAGSDVQLSSKSYSSSVTFNSLSSSIAATGTYYFITADLAAGSTGNLTTTIANGTAMTLTAGTVSTSFSNAALSSAAVPLPIQLLSFTAHSKPDGVDLHWTTAKEENFAGFEPERSVDGGTWSRMSFVAGKANNTTATTQYSYTDNNPVTGHIYYRLKMVDVDGSYTYSKQLTVVKSNHNAALQNYPNPFTGTTSIAFQLPVSSTATLKVYNNMGAEVSTLINKQLDAGSYTVSFDGTSLPAGLYHYTLRYGNETLSGTMLLKK